MAAAHRHSGGGGLRVLHTSDWHLGHSLHELPRIREHRAFLRWLTDTVVERDIDLLLVAGDVFDAANPPARALELYYRFLADLLRRAPNLQVVVIGGNHDSPSRLDAPSPVLEPFSVRVVGGVPRGPGGTLDVERMLVPIERGGEIVAVVCAVPFLRAADLPLVEGADDPLVAGVERLYQDVFSAARSRAAGAPLIAMGHGFLVGTELSRLSERKVLGGNQHPLPIEVFPDDVAYVALGHLHKAQRVGGNEHIRYCGAPIPLSLSEGRYRHQVVEVRFEDGALDSVESIAIPRTVDLLRVPSSGSLPLEDALRELAALPAASGESELAPYLEVCLQLDGPVPDLRAQVAAALDGRQARLCKITLDSRGSGASLSEVAKAERLADLDPEEVFVRRFQRQHDGEPPPEMLRAFRELLSSVHEEERS